MAAIALPRRSRTRLNGPPRWAFGARPHRARLQMQVTNLADEPFFRSRSGRIRWPAVEVKGATRSSDSKDRDLSRYAIGPTVALFYMLFSVTLNGIIQGESMNRPGVENPFVFGEVITERAFVDRSEELEQVLRDMRDRQELFLLSPRRFGKSSLVAVPFERLKAEGLRTVIIPVSN